MHISSTVESQEDHHATGSAISLPPGGQVWVPLEPAQAMLLYGKSLQSLREASTLKGWRNWDYYRSRTPATLIFSTLDSECPAQEGHWTPGCPQIGMPRLVDVFACVSGVKEWKLWPRFGRKFSRIMLSLTWPDRKVGRSELGRRGDDLLSQRKQLAWQMQRKPATPPQEKGWTHGKEKQAAEVTFIN